MKEKPRSTRPRGRPRSDAVDRALAKAALAEFVAHGFHQMSMESIAARAGVSKVSLYRRWPSKLAVAADVFQLLSPERPTQDCGSFEADVRFLLEQSITTSSAKFAAKILMRTVGEISGNPELLALYRKYMLAPRLDQLRSLVERARTRKELRADVPTDVACAMIAGPLFLYYLTVLAETEVDLPENLAEQLARAILEGISR